MSLDLLSGDAATHHRAVHRNRLRCTTKTSGVLHKPIEEVASTLFLHLGQRHESVFDSVSSRENLRGRTPDHNVSWTCRYRWQFPNVEKNRSMRGPVRVQKTSPNSTP